MADRFFSLVMILAIDWVQIPSEVFLRALPHHRATLFIIVLQACFQARFPSDVNHFAGVIN